MDDRLQGADLTAWVDLSSMHASRCHHTHRGDAGRNTVTYHETAVATKTVIVVQVRENCHRHFIQIVCKAMRKCSRLMDGFDFECMLFFAI